MKVGCCCILLSRVPLKSETNSFHREEPQHQSTRNHFRGDTSSLQRVVNVECSLLRCLPGGFYVASCSPSFQIQEGITTFYNLWASTGLLSPVFFFYCDNHSVYFMRLRYWQVPTFRATRRRSQANGKIIERSHRFSNHVFHLLGIG